MVKRIVVLACALPLFAANAWAQEEDFQRPKKEQVSPSTNQPLQMVEQKGVADVQKGRGKVFVKQNVWDFGHVAQSIKVTHRFVLQNVGDDTLFIERIKPT